MGATVIGLGEILLSRNGAGTRLHWVLGAASCVFLVGPWTRRNPVQYTIAAMLIAIGVVLWFVTLLVDRAAGQKPVDPTMEDVGGSGPRN